MHPTQGHTGTPMLFFGITLTQRLKDRKEGTPSQWLSCLPNLLKKRPSRLKKPERHLEPWPNLKSCRYFFPGLWHSALSQGSKSCQMSRYSSKSAPRSPVAFRTDDFSMYDKDSNYWGLPGHEELGPCWTHLVNAVSPKLDQSSLAEHALAHLICP